MILVKIGVVVLLVVGIVINGAMWLLVYFAQKKDVKIYYTRNENKPANIDSDENKNCVDGVLCYPSSYFDVLEICKKCNKIL